MLHFRKTALLFMGIFLVTVILFQDIIFSQTPLARPAASAGAPAEEKAPVVRSVPKTVATVNGEEISYQRLSRECVKEYGQDVLGRLISRYILETACKKGGVEITNEDLQGELDTMSKRFGLNAEQYLGLIERERGISPQLFIRDVIYQQAAIRKLAGKEAQPTEEEIKIEFERRYGPGVKARIIAVSTKEEALQLREEALKDLEKFPELAQKKSLDPYSAGLGGLVPDIRRHLNPPEVEKVIFSLKPGEVSQPMEVGNQYMIILCEELIPQDPAIKLEDIREELEQIAIQGKMKEAGVKLSQKLMTEAKIDIFLGDATKSAARPGVAAIVDGNVISIAVLGDECILRYGRQALEGIINRTLIEQAVKKEKIQITDEDLNKELARVALESLPPKEDGSANVEMFLEKLMQEHGATAQRYREDVLWPSLALAKLVEGKIVITPEELQRGYVANFGKKVKCRVIILNDLRTAQRVWSLARENPTEDNFIELAKKFSADGASRALGGAVPPISQFGGQPELEKEAFKLETGELSGIIQLQNVYVILLCTGFTEPIGVTFEEVKDLVQKDIVLKKTQMAIEEKFQELQTAAAIDNYLTGSTKAPEKKEVPEVKE
ncbi:MAG: peptidylprolyl isomerase [Planctomycetia bacterium]|nr:peptidylprolyl isomerase [Planctomycetia bacterium]